MYSRENKILLHFARFIFGYIFRIIVFADENGDENDSRDNFIRMWGYKEERKIDKSIKIIDKLRISGDFCWLHNGFL